MVVLVFLETKLSILITDPLLDSKVHNGSTSFIYLIKSLRSSSVAGSALGEIRLSRWYLDKSKSFFSTEPLKL